MPDMGVIRLATPLRSGPDAPKVAHRATPPIRQPRALAKPLEVRMIRAAAPLALLLSLSAHLPAAAQDAAADPAAQDAAATPAQDGDGEITVSHGYSNFGELKYGPDEVLAYVNAEAPKGGEISLWSESNFDSFNVFTRKGVAEFTGASLIYEDILTGVADDPYGTYCYLCTTMEYPASKDWVIFNLRDDVTFSDGTPMTAEDLKFSFDLLLEQGITEYRSVVEGFIESVEVLGPHRIKFTFTPEAPRRDVIGIAGGTNAWSKAWFEETGTRVDESSPRPFLGTGPYVLGDVDMGRSVTYVRDENWWGAEHPLNIGRWNFDAVRIEVFGDSAAALEGFKAGEYTFRIENTSKDWATAYDFPAIDKGWVVKESLPDGNITTAQGFIFNLKREKWGDNRVRDAVRMMFNFEWSNATLFYGLYQRPASFWGGSDLAATGTPTPEEAAILEPLVREGLLPEAILSDEAVMPPVNDEAQNAPGRRTLREATRLLNEAGYTAGDDGLMRNEAGEVLELVIIQTSPAFDRIVNPYVENLRRIGIDARLERVDTAQYVERRRSGDWDLTNQSLGQDFEPGIGLRQWFDSSTAEDSSRNLMALRDPAVDRLITGVIDATTLDELRPAVRALDRVLRAQGFWVPQWSNAEHWVAYWDQYRHPDTLPPLALGALEFWWFDQEGADRLKAAGAL